MSIEAAQREFIESLEGDLTPEQAAQLLELEGDTGTAPETEAVPAAAPAPGGNPEPSDGPDPGKTQDDKPGAEPPPVDESKLTPENAVILAADGKHTIEYQKLLDARSGEQHWREQAEIAHAKLAQLSAEANQRAQAGEKPTVVDNQIAAAKAAIDQGVDISLFGDFSEEALAKGVLNLVDHRVEVAVRKALEPIQQRQAMEETDAHYGAIRAAHPDADSIVQSREFANWINAQPRFLHGTYEAILERGSTQDIIAMFDAYKQATDAPQQAPTLDPRSVKAAAKAAIASAPNPVPSSLTDFPGGRPAGLTRSEQLAQITDGRELLEAMDNMNMTNEQIEQYLNRTV